jgi:iron complex transport system ATP-binding protein
MIHVNDISYRIGEVDICKDMNLDIASGTFYGIIGPNGSGKTTLLKQICRVLKPIKGVILLDGTNIETMTNKETAKQIGVLLQENELNFDYTVREMVMMGRAPYHSGMQREAPMDQEIIMQCLEKTGMADRVERHFVTLSGGEKQRVLLARALAQQANTLLLDEPTNNLDIGHQYQMFELLQALPLTIFMIIHDLNLASEFCDKLAIVNYGRIVSTGTPREVITKQLLREVFSVEAVISYDANNSRPYIRYLRSSGLSG